MHSKPKTEDVNFIHTNRTILEWIDDVQWMENFTSCYIKTSQAMNRQTANNKDLLPEKYYRTTLQTRCYHAQDKKK